MGNIELCLPVLTGIQYRDAENVILFLNWPSLLSLEWILLSLVSGFISAMPLIQRDPV